ncbi:MAG: hypothetical protein HC802_04420 [Caldilineaceae bacterium]|nr:hypothetical protein [Caldilineaceae bacterium]
MSTATKTTKNGAGPVAPAQISQEEAQEISSVAHQVPGRTRIRVKGHLRTRENMAKIKKEIEQQEGVKSVSVNHRTGSVLIKHERHVEGHVSFKKAVENAKLLTETVLDVPEEDSRYNRIAEIIEDQTWGIDHYVYQRTGERIHFGYVIPAAIAGLGVFQIVVYGITLEMLPGPVLIWIAYEILKRLNADERFPPRQAEQADTASDVPISVAPVAA